ncbi:hypothetical protein [Streptomyces aidingensis]|uniref:Uncharacterized protein n=1 Tax=Streptomyces aidingensis TaxID=910347 RepID=A0A1I1PSD0_9ACTN|nr:hypothetical protein [Streptomyces aidingensis]SFD12756.1 hypothetical protein SAMN05421773_11025 [Streptomyces aidingensis]
MAELTQKTPPGDRPAPDMQGLLGVLGCALDMTAGIPEVQDPDRAAWSIGYRPVAGICVEVTLHDPVSVELLERIAAALGGGEVRDTGTVSGAVRLHEVAGRLGDIPVRVSGWVPLPSEREALLARLAELDAREAAGDAGAGVSR